MSTKSKNKKSPIALTIGTNYIESEFYELEIADIKKKIDRLKCLNLEGDSKNIGPELKQRDELTKNDRELEELNRKYNNIIKCYDKIKNEKLLFREQYLLEIVTKDDGFKKMVKDLSSGIRYFTSELIVLESFVINRETMIDSYEDAEQIFYKKELNHSTKLTKMDDDLEIFKNNVKQDVDRQLSNISVDFLAKTNKIKSQHVLRLTGGNAALIIINRIIENQVNSDLFEEKSLHISDERGLVFKNQKLVHLCIDHKKTLINMVEDKKSTDFEINEMKNCPMNSVKLDKVIENAVEDLNIFMHNKHKSKQAVYFLMHLEKQLRIQEDCELWQNHKLLHSKYKYDYYLQMINEPHTKLTKSCSFFDVNNFSRFCINSLNSNTNSMIKEFQEFHLTPSHSSINSVISYKDQFSQMSFHDGIKLSTTNLASEKNLVSSSIDKNYISAIENQTLFDVESNYEPLLFSDSDTEQSTISDIEIDDETANSDFSSVD